ncbi:MAG: ROK family protein [Candidatus Rokubacteria bacterium]|nr:ROK family protein [Candidatus Rokubacteria bacterium]
MHDDAAILSVDIGGTTTAAGLVTPEGLILSCETAPTLGRGRGRVLEGILALLVATRADAVRRGVRLRGVGVGVPGAVDATTGQIGRDIQNLPELAGCPLGARVTEALDLPAVVDNDVNALTLGESYYGAARGARHFALLALGTGVGGGLYLNGELVRGVSGYGGELGHIPVDLNGRACFCGGRGCLKAYVSGPDIAAQAREALAETEGSALLALAGSPEALTARHVFEAAGAGDPLALDVVERVCQALGAGLAAILNGFNPELIVLTGGVAESLEAFMDAVLRWTRAYAFDGAYRAARIACVGIGKSASIRGAAALYLYEEARRGGARG